MIEHRDIIDIRLPLPKKEPPPTDQRWGEVVLILVVFAAGLTLIWLLG